MYKIKVIGEAQTDHQNLEELDGIDCQDRFSEYFDSDFSFVKNVTGGYMEFKYENGKLMTYTVYNSDRLLTDEELNELMDYTQGQWSDGIGEGFEQFPVYLDENEEVYISPWFYGQDIKIIQE
jgi:hypothetical protein